MNYKLALIFLAASTFPSLSFGFLENATHGYSNCLTCHYNPAGGNLLNDYGRSLSSELMSTWSSPGAEQFLGGALKETKWAKFGGDLRTLQSYSDTETSEDWSLFLMQNNVEIGLKHKNVMLIGTVGTREGPSGPFNPEKSDFISERHYVLVNASETSRVRAGKFRINYGINDPNHNRVIKSALGFRPYSETYNLEYSKFFDSGDIFFNYSLGRVDLNRTNNDERSVSTKLSHYLGGKSKISLNYLYGETPNRTRQLMGSSGVTPITEKSYAVYEVDYENTKTLGSRTERILSHLRLGYEFFKGFKGYTLYDYQNTLNQENTRLTAPGFGIQWLPFPHFELQIEYQAMKFESQKTRDFGFVMFHIYY